MSENLELVKQIEANEEVIVQIYDMCNDKKEYKKFMNFCKDAGKEFKALQKVKETKIFQVKQVQISDTVNVSATIMNFRPDSYEKLDNPLEITVRISDDSKNGFTAHGSAIYGGCNEAEYNEFIGLISSGYSDFTKEF
jgi:hypothetical protein